MYYPRGANNGKQGLQLYGTSSWKWTQQGSRFSIKYIHKQDMQGGHPTFVTDVTVPPPPLYYLTDIPHYVAITSLYVIDKLIFVTKKRLTIKNDVIIIYNSVGILFVDTQNLVEVKLMKWTFDLTWMDLTFWNLKDGCLQVNETVHNLAML